MKLYFIVKDEKEKTYRGYGRIFNLHSTIISNIVEICDSFLIIERGKKNKKYIIGKLVSYNPIDRRNAEEAIVECSVKCIKKKRKEISDIIRKHYNTNYSSIIFF